MRWLMILLLVSLAAMLIVAAGAALHVGVQRAKMRRQRASRVDSTRDTDLEP